MTRTVTATEAKAKLLALLTDVERGEEVEITRHGRPIARITPLRNHMALKDKYAGLIRIADPDDDLLSANLEMELT